MPNQSMNQRKPMLPVSVPRQKPDRAHALPQHTKHTIRNLSNVLIYLWLNNGNGFWFYISHVTDHSVVGYAWNGTQWTSREIHFKMVWSYY